MAPAARHEGEAAAGGAPKLHQAAFERGLLGLTAAITMAVCEPPPMLDKTTYLLPRTGALYAGVAQVTLMTSFVWASGGRLRDAGMKKLVYYASLVVAATLTTASPLQ
ncbi:unnamed protein product [Urochloa humidicola]